MPNHANVHRAAINHRQVSRLRKTSADAKEFGRAFQLIVRGLFKQLADQTTNTISVRGQEVDKESPLALFLVTQEVNDAANRAEFSVKVYNRSIQLEQRVFQLLG